jgi:hypothetical protein
MCGLMGKSTSTFVKHNTMNNQEKFGSCCTIFVDTFLGKECGSKTRAEENKSKVCVRID